MVSVTEDEGTEEVVWDDQAAPAISSDDCEGGDNGASFAGGAASSCSLDRGKCCFLDTSGDENRDLLGTTGEEGRVGGGVFWSSAC